MALSMDEQRMLAEIERRLAAENPGLASDLTSFRKPSRVSVLRSTRGRVIGSLFTVVVVAMVSLMVYAMLPFRSGGRTVSNHPVTTTSVNGGPDQAKIGVEPVKSSAAKSSAAQSSAAAVFGGPVFGGQDLRLGPVVGPHGHGQDQPVCPHLGQQHRALPECPRGGAVRHRRVRGGQQPLSPSLISAAVRRAAGGQECAPGWPAAHRPRGLRWGDHWTRCRAAEAISTRARAG